MSNPKPDPTGRLVMVHSAPNAVAGMLARALLEDEGIRVLVKGEGVGPYASGPVYLLVHEHDEARALAVLEGAEEGGGAPNDPLSS